MSEIVLKADADAMRARSRRIHVADGVAVFRPIGRTTVLHDDRRVDERDLPPAVNGMPGSAEGNDVPISGRNRRYYRITDRGREQLKVYLGEWLAYRGQIDKILFEGATE